MKRDNSKRGAGANDGIGKGGLIGVTIQRAAQEGIFLLIPAEIFF